MPIKDGADGITVNRLYYMDGDKAVKIGEIKELPEFTTVSNSEDLENVPESYIFKPEEFTFEFTMEPEVWKYFILMHKLGTNNWRRMHGFRAVRRRRNR